MAEQLEHFGPPRPFDKYLDGTAWLIDPEEHGLPDITTLRMRVRAASDRRGLRLRTYRRGRFLVVKTERGRPSAVVIRYTSTAALDLLVLEGQAKRMERALAENREQQQRLHYTIALEALRREAHASVPDDGGSDESDWGTTHGPNAASVA